MENRNPLFHLPGPGCNARLFFFFGCKGGVHLEPERRAEIYQGVGWRAGPVAFGRKTRLEPRTPNLPDCELVLLGQLVPRRGLKGEAGGARQMGAPPQKAAHSSASRSLPSVCRRKSTPFLMPFFCVPFTVSPARPFRPPGFTALRIVEKQQPSFPCLFFWCPLPSARPRER
jgi:hypothetical protein